MTQTARLKKEETGLSSTNDPLEELLEELLQDHLEEEEEVVEVKSTTEGTTTTEMVEENQSMTDTLDQIKQELKRSKREMDQELITGATLMTISQDSLTVLLPKELQSRLEKKTQLKQLLMLLAMPLLPSMILLLKKNQRK